MTPDDHKIVQLARASAEEIDQYVGFDGEITADTSNYWLRLHDGKTPGGHKIPNLDALTELFQARSNELDGLLGFKDQDKGFLARLGPAAYRLRSLTVNEEALQIAQANGYGGNPLLDLADDISRNVKFSGVVTFTQQIVGTGGFKGNVEGDVVGDVTGDVLGNVEGNLTGDSNGHHTGSQTGDVDVRGHALQLDAGQIHLASLNQDVLDLIEANSAKLGFILIWSGAANAIPDGWALCDGANGTPDLRDRFVIGAGDAYAVGASGGTTNPELQFTTNQGGAHEHTGSAAAHVLTEAELPSHRHLVAHLESGKGTTVNSPALAITTGKETAGNSNYDLIGTASEPNVARTSADGGGQGHSHDVTIESGGAHTHDVDVHVDIIQPYYALAYIMRIS